MLLNTNEGGGGGRQKALELVPGGGGVHGLILPTNIRLDKWEDVSRVGCLSHGSIDEREMPCSSGAHF